MPTSHVIVFYVFLSRAVVAEKDIVKKADNLFIT